MKRTHLLHWIIQPLITVILLIIVAFIYAKVTDTSILNSSANQRTFTVDGTGKVTVTPDTFYTDFTVQQSGTTQDDAKNKGNQIQQKAVTALKKLGFTDKDIKTLNFNINPEYNYNTGIVPNGKPTISGYTMLTTTRVTAKSSDKVNKAIDALTPLGVNVSGVQSTISNTDNYKDKARQMAVQQAKQKAQSLADAAGFKLGKIASIKEGSDNSDINPQPMIMRDKSFAALPSSPTQINPGTEEVSAQVTLTYYIRD